MFDLASRVLRDIGAHELLPDGTRCLVAVSGGPDSMALLHFLQAHAAPKGWNLVAAHLNHRLRGRESDGDEAFLRAHFQDRGIEAVFGSADIPKLKAKTKDSMEMTARKARHEFLAHSATEANCQVIATGHQADDQVELFFLRLFRGAGGEGLSGMAWSSPSPADHRLQLVRPFLHCTRASIWDYVKKHNIECRHDSSNQDTRILRNKIRYALLPLIRNAGFEIQDKVMEACDILEADSSFVAETARNWQRAPQGPFEELPKALQRWLLKRALLESGTTPSFELVEFLRKNPGRRRSVGRDKQLMRTAEGGLILSGTGGISGGPGGHDTKEVVFRITEEKGSLEFGPIEIEWEIIPRNHLGQTRPREPRVEMFDADEIGREIKLRHWRPGDRFHPIGLAKETKLQDIFTNGKWRRSERHEAILAATRCGVLFWVQGLRISERFKLTPSTRNIMIWKWAPIGEDRRWKAA